MLRIANEWFKPTTDHWLERAQYVQVRERLIERDRIRPSAVAKIFYLPKSLILSKNRWSKKSYNSENFSNGGRANTD